jgi:hypothetical protein
MWTMMRECHQAPATDEFASFTESSLSSELTNQLDYLCFLFVKYDDFLDLHPGIHL